MITLALGMYLSNRLGAGDAEWLQSGAARTPVGAVGLVLAVLLAGVGVARLRTLG